jgi:hypothetical protein
MAWNAAEAALKPAAFVGDAGYPISRHASARPDRSMEVH